MNVLCQSLFLWRFHCLQENILRGSSVLIACHKTTTLFATEAYKLRQSSQPAFQIDWSETQIPA